jgi:hypothetical protein
LKRGLKRQKEGFQLCSGPKERKKERKKEKAVNVFNVRGVKN